MYIPVDVTYTARPPCHTAEVQISLCNVAEEQGLWIRGKTGLCVPTQQNSISSFPGSPTLCGDSMILEGAWRPPGLGGFTWSLCSVTYRREENALQHRRVSSAHCSLHLLITLKRAFRVSSPDECSFSPNSRGLSLSIDCDECGGLKASVSCVWDDLYGEIYVLY